MLDQPELKDLDIDLQLWIELVSVNFLKQPISKSFPDYDFERIQEESCMAMQRISTINVGWIYTDSSFSAALCHNTRHKFNNMTFDKNNSFSE